MARDEVTAAKVEWGPASDVRLRGGAVLPTIGFGTWRLSGDTGYDSIRAALDVGYRHIDTATMYGNEAQVGRAVRDSGIPRDKIFITTKLPEGRSGQERRTLEESLRELGTDYVDLWLVHWPPGGVAAPATWREFIAARQRQAVTAIGVSNYSIAQIDELIRATGEVPAVNQVPWSPTHHDPGVLAALRDRGVVVEGYSPLKACDFGDPTLVSVAESHAVTVAQVVLRWHLQHGIVIIPKSARAERIRANLDLAGFTLTDAEMDRVDRIAVRPGPPR